MVWGDLIKGQSSRCCGRVFVTERKDDSCHMLSKEKTKAVYIHEHDFIHTFTFFPIDLSNWEEVVKWKGRRNFQLIIRELFQGMTGFEAVNNLK